MFLIYLVGVEDAEELGGGDKGSFWVELPSRAVEVARLAVHLAWGHGYNSENKRSILYICSRRFSVHLAWRHGCK